MQAYLDNSATTRCSEGVRDIVIRTMMEDYGNPSSKHDKGMDAEKYLREARGIIARTMKVDEKEIFFTSGGTESNNWALIGAAMANRRSGMHLVTTAIEHAAVVQPMMYLKELGFEVTYVPVDRYGRLDLEKLREAIREDTILVSTMYVNNEIGTLEPMEEIGKIIRERNPKALWHVDAIQAYGKYRIYPKRMGIDMLSVSGHKIHGPKGVGFLYVNSRVKIYPLILGGGQQRGMRSGTDNVSGIAGLGCAAREAYEDFERKTAHLYELKQFFMEEIAKLPNTVQNSLPGEEGAPHIVSVSFRGVRSEVLLHALEERGIQVSSGSACSSNKKLPVSSVLKEIGMEKELLDSTIRFSFCEHTTKEELIYCLEQLMELLPVLSRYSAH
ncbi:MAG: cysteine desulfurase family protein [Hominisplanchenecus sp.]